MKSDCLPCRVGRSHTFCDDGSPNLAYAYEGSEPPIQDSTYEDNWWQDIPVVKSEEMRANQDCNVAGCSGDHDFEHDEYDMAGWSYEETRRFAKALVDDPEVVEDPDQNPKELIYQSIELVYGDRQGAYGHPYDDYSRTAGMWSSFLGISISPEQAALMMVLLKISRERNRPKDDNIVDAHGYLLCYGRIQGRDKAS